MSKSNQNFKIGKLKLKETAHKQAIPFRKPKKEQPSDEESEELKVKDQIITYEPVAGTGVINVSGKTIHGEGTKFKEEIQKGDSILIEHPLLKTLEERAVVLVLADKSILLEEPFLQDYSAFVPYFIRKKSKVILGQNLTTEYKKKIEQLGKTKGIKKGEMEVRVKKGTWSYEKKKVEVDQGLSRQQLLDIRMKMGKDKFCW